MWVKVKPFKKAGYKIKAIRFHTPKADGTTTVVIHKDILEEVGFKHGELVDVLINEEDKAIRVQRGDTYVIKRPLQKGTLPHGLVSVRIPFPTDEPTTNYKVRKGDILDVYV